MSAYESWAGTADTSPHLKVNAGFEALGQALLFARKEADDTGLDVGIGGGPWIPGSADLADDTVTCADDDDTYIVALRSTGALSASTGTTNWNDTETYGRVAIASFADGALTDFRDYRWSEGGIFRTDAAAAGTVTGPGSSTSGNLAAFAGTGGDVLADSGVAPSTDGTLATNSNAKLPTEQAVKTYVDGKVSGLSWKQAVRAATTAAGTLASSFENGDAVDGVTLATGNRILIKNQTSASENGIYVVNASGAPTRATDADSGAELVNASVYVSEGATNADTQWTCTTDAPITVGSTSLAFAQLTSGGAVSSVNGQTGAVSLNGGYVGAKGSDIASASTVDLSAATGDFVDVTGTTTVTAFGTVASGVLRAVRFTGVLTLTHNATSLILPGGASITTAAGDVGTFRSLGSGNWVCVSYQKANGQAVSSSGGGSGTKTYAVFTPMTSEPPASNFATLDTRNSRAVLEFDQSTEEAALWNGLIPEAASLGSGLKIRIHWRADTATSGDVVWGASIERDATDYDSDSFDTEATATGTANGTSGIVTVTEITLTNIDSVTAGDGFYLKIARKAASGSDTMTGDAQVSRVEVRSAA